MILVVLVCTIILTETYELSDRASFLVNNAFEQHLSTTVTWCQSDPNIVTDFLSKYHGLVTTLDLKISVTNMTEIYEKMDFEQVVFFADNPEEYKYFLTNLSETIIRPIKILLLITVPIKETSTLEIYTKISFDNDASDILIVSSDAEEGNVTLSTFMPYSPTGCGNYTPVTLNPENSELYPYKFHNFYGCPIKVIEAYMPSTIPPSKRNLLNPGMDVVFMDFVFKKLNMSVIYSFTNYSGTQAFGFVANSTYDVCLPTVILNKNRYLTAQPSHVFKTLDIVLCAPKQREIYAWAKVLLPFFTNITPLIIASFLLFMGSVALMQRFGKYRRNSPKGIIFGTLGIFLGQGVKFVTKYWLNNGIFMLWIWYCTVIRIAYQGDLVDGLQKTFLEPHLQTIDQAMKAVDGYGGPEGLLQTFRNSSSNKNLNIIPWSIAPIYFNEISKGKRFLLIMDFLFIQHSYHMVQLVDERLSSIPKVIFMRPRWGPAKEVDRRIVQLFEGGFEIKIRHDSQEAIPRDDSSGVKPLAMTTVASCFLGLIISYFLWSIVLCVEIVWYRFVEKKKVN